MKSRENINHKKHNNLTKTTGDNTMKNSKTLKRMLVLLIMAGMTAYFSACSDNSTTTASNTTDNGYITSVLDGGNTQPEGTLMSSENSDLNDGMATGDNDNGPMNPIDSLKKWGRKVANVNVNYSITDIGDTLKSVLVTRTISGYYIIRGYAGGNPDSVNKPYTEVFTRTIVFKRIKRTADPRLNWALYQVSMANGKTTSPQVGTDQIKMNNISIYVNGASTPAYSFNGPDFTQNIFTTVWFGGNGIPEFHPGESIKIVVSLNSNQPDTDYVAWHWARNTFGFHRIPFALTSSNGNGDRTYTKTFNIYSSHKLGVFNGYISANTHKSLWDDNQSLFSSTTVGTPYKITQ